MPKIYLRNNSQRRSKKKGFVNKGPEFSFLHNAFGELGSGKSSK